MDLDQEHLAQERKMMDEQLSRERKAVDEEIRKTAQQIAQKTDSKIDTVREKVEKTLETQRSTHDELIQEVAPVEHKEVLEKERMKIDVALQKERAITDLARETEKAQLQQAEKEIFQAERDATDEALEIERKHSDEVLLQLKDLLERKEVGIHSLEDFLAMVSHDLRNPLNAILMASQAIRRELPENPRISFVSFLEVIERASRNMQRLVEDLVDYQRIESGSMVLDKKPMNLNQLIAQTIEAFRPMVDKKGVLLRHTTSAERLNCTCDSTRISQVLDNLLSNALRYTPKGSAIEIRSARVQNGVEVAVLDQGTGVPEEKQKMIFERFEQAGEKNRQGLGLGLYISKFIVEAHGGRIWYEPRPDGGSSFTFRLACDGGE